MILYLLPILGAIFCGLTAILTIYLFAYWIMPRRLKQVVSQIMTEAQFQPLISDFLSSTETQDKITSLLDDFLNNVVTRFGYKIPMASLFLSGSIVDKFKFQAKEEFFKALPDLREKASDYMSESTSQIQLIGEKFTTLNIPLFQKALYNSVKKDCLLLILGASALGFFIGLLELLFLLHLGG